jgi:anti-sigma-K factor RskA
MQVQRLGGELRADRAKLSESEQQLAEQEKWNEVLRAPQARVSVLEATTDGDPRLRARATYDPATKRAVVVFENFQKPTARDYQLWVIKDGVPASLGVIQADADGRAVLHLEDVGDSFALSAFAVSLEPEGGSPSPAPTGPVVMLGKLSG